MNKKNKKKKDWFDSHVIVTGFKSNKQNKKLKQLIKEQFNNELLKEYRRI
jgi:hypothetical protein